MKLRGHRIELGEVEGVLRGLGPVAAAAVVADTDDRGNVRLIAYWTPTADTPASSPADLRDALKAHLPAYMIPAAFGQLDAIPLTSNGKLDRRALPMPDAKSTPGAASSAVLTPVERALSGIWGELLGSNGISGTDSFFEVGGHSLLAVRLVSRLAQIFKVQLPLRAIFEHPTLTGMTGALVAAEPKPGHVARVAGLLEQIRRMSADEVRDRAREHTTDS